MLSIFVCEDHPAQRRAIVQIIQNTILMDELDMRLVLDTEDPYIVLETVRDNHN